MKKGLFVILFLFFLSPIFSQVLKNPVYDRFGTVNYGKLLVVSSFNEIWMSNVSIEDINTIKKELNEAKNTIVEQGKEIERTKKTISTQERLIDEQKREIDNMKRTIDRLTRDVDDLKRK